MSAFASVPPVCAVPGSNESECTFALAGEDHTLGNALRYALNKQPDVVFAGYSVPHPSDDLVNVRVQTSGRITATQALRNAVTDLTAQCEHITTTFQAAVAKAKAEAMSD